MPRSEQHTHLTGSQAIRKILPSTRSQNHQWGSGTWWWQIHTACLQRSQEILTVLCPWSQGHLLFYSHGSQLPILYSFAFQWKDPQTGFCQQCMWTTMLQGFRDSPHLFAQVLALDRREVKLEKGGLIHYIHSLFICSPTKELFDQNTTKTFSCSVKRCYKVSQHKAQISPQKVIYLGDV